MTFTTTRSIKIGWIALLAIFFLVFSAWYGGNGKPLSAEEGARLIAELRATYADAPHSDGQLPDNLEAMIAKDDGKEFYAVNLEQLKAGDAAQAADRAYGETVIPLLFKRAGHPVFVSDRAGLMLGKYGEEVDRVAVVRYRSLRDLINMAKDPVMVDVSPYKFESLDHTEVFITRPFITFMHVRFVLALILIVFAWAGLSLIHWLSTRRAPSEA
ncbi:MAG: hypothetical protein AAGL11_00635 [Pseudomonadota bacterium]